MKAFVIADSRCSDGPVVCWSRLRGAWAVFRCGPRRRSFGPGAWSPSVALWVLFPLFTLIGYGLIVVGAKAPHLPRLSFGVSCLLLLLAVVAAVGLVLTATSFVPVVGSPLSLWYVLGVAGVLGSIGAASHRRASSLGAAGT